MGLPLNENPAYENMDDYVQRQQDVLEQSFQLAREQPHEGKQLTTPTSGKLTFRQANGFGITTTDVT